MYGTPLAFEVVVVDDWGHRRTGAQSSIMNSCSATDNLGLGELCPSLGTLVYRAAEEARARTVHWEQSVVGSPGRAAQVLLDRLCA